MSEREKAYMIRRVTVPLPPEPVSFVAGGEVPEPHGPTLQTLEVEQWGDQTYRHTTPGTHWTKPITRTVVAELFDRDPAGAAVWLHTGGVPTLRTPTESIS